MGMKALPPLRLVLAAGFSELACGLLFVPRLAEVLARGVYGPGFRFHLGVSQLARGIALLLQHLAEEE